MHIDPGWNFAYVPMHSFEVELMRVNSRPRLRRKMPESINAGKNVAKVSDLLKGIGGFVDLVSDMAQKGQEKVENTSEIKAQDGISAMYGFSVKLDGTGIPQVERFGNIIQNTEKWPVVEEAREPFVDIFEEKDNLEVIFELPGIEEEDIHYELKENSLILKATSQGRKYTKEVPLPFKTSPVKTAYKNGVFNLKLKKITKK